MSLVQTNMPSSKHDQKKLLERIEKHYEQVDRQFEELEAKLADLGIEPDKESPRPLKPR